jgi:hypothetical protein
MEISFFDKEYISFEDNGNILFADDVKDAIKTWNIEIKNVGIFLPQQQKYLKEHR